MHPMVRACADCAALFVGDILLRPQGLLCMFQLFALWRLGCVRRIFSALHALEHSEPVLRACLWYHVNVDLVVTGSQQACLRHMSPSHACAPAYARDCALPVLCPCAQLMHQIRCQYWYLKWLVNLHSVSTFTTSSHWLVVRLYALSVSTQFNACTMTALAVPVLGGLCVVVGGP
jgi:hypothetical protein